MCWWWPRCLASASEDVQVTVEDDLLTISADARRQEVPQGSAAAGELHPGEDADYLQQRRSGNQVYEMKSLI